MTKARYKAPDSSKIVVAAPLGARLAKKLYNLVEAIPDEVWDTNPLKAGASTPTKRNVLEGLNAEFFQPLSLDVLAFNPDASFRGHAHSPGNTPTFKDQLADYSQQQMLDQVELNTLVFNILKELALFKYQWFEVIMFRFGFWDGTVWKLAEIGEQLGISRERVRQIQEKALEELRSILLREALLAEVRELGVLRRRRVFSVAPPKGSDPLRKGKRGRPPKVYTIEPLSKMDVRTWAPLPEIAKILGIPLYTIRNWMSGSGFPEPRKDMANKIRVWSVIEVLNWGILHDRVRINYEENDESTQ